MYLRVDVGENMLVEAWHLIGSSASCSPPVLDTDIDFMVLVTDLQDTTDALYEHAWENCCASWAGRKGTDLASIMDELKITDGSGPGLRSDGYSVEDQYGASFTAFRKGKYNLIVTDDKTLYLRSVGAHMVCKHLNLLDKQDRIALYRAVKYGEDYNGPLP